MELMLNATSPFARVARICAIERGLGDRLELRWVDPWSDDPELLAVNPVGRVPALRTDDGRCIAEALLIAEHLDRLGDGPRLFPEDDGGRALELAGFGQGLMEAAFTTAIARKHQGPESDDSVLGRRRHAAIPRTLDRLAELVGDGAPDQPDIGTVTAGVALAYLGFRLPEHPVADGRPALARWHEAVGARDSFRETAFQ